MARHSQSNPNGSAKNVEISKRKLSQAPTVIAKTMEKEVQNKTSKQKRKRFLRCLLYRTKVKL